MKMTRVEMKMGESEKRADRKKNSLGCAFPGIHGSASCRSRVGDLVRAGEAGM